MNDLRGKTAVITGAASGIGLAMANRFAAEGMQLVLADIEAAPLQAVGRDLRSKGHRVVAEQLDVRDLAQIRALEATAKERFGNVHLLCNNAGVGGGGPVSGLDDLELWKWTIDINLWGVIYGCKVFLPAMMEHGEQAHIVNTASMAGLAAPAYMGPYNISKYGVVALSETMSREIQLADASVGVSVLCPAFVATGIANSQRNLPKELQAEPAEDTTEMRALVEALVAEGIPPAEVASAVVDAVIDDRFWILTHPETKPGIVGRANEIVNGVNPSPQEAIQ